MAQLAQDIPVTGKRVLRVLVSGDMVVFKTNEMLKGFGA
jgi:hypothetical protein